MLSVLPHPAVHFPFPHLIPAASHYATCPPSGLRNLCSRPGAQLHHPQRLFKSEGEFLTHCLSSNIITHIEILNTEENLKKITPVTRQTNTEKISSWAKWTWKHKNHL